MRILLGLIVTLSAFVLAGCPPKVAYDDVLPGRPIEFPRDHYSHDNFRIEWWYFTGHLEADGGGRYGFELVFFRKRSEGEWRLGLPVWWFRNPAYVAHFAITDHQKHSFQFDERAGLRGPLRGGAAADKFVVWNEDWRAMELGDRWYLTARMPGYAIDLLIEPEKPPVLHGEQGYSRKSEEVGASFYYSLTRMSVDGQIQVDGRPVRVSGKAWMDHEILSPAVSRDLVGWDWFSIQLDDGHELMLFALNTRSGEPDPWSSGTLVFPDGTSDHFYSENFEVRNLSFWKSAETRTTYPSSWQVKVPRHDIDLILVPVLRDQELRPRLTQISYWEGEIAVQGTFKGRPVTGDAYVELSGYGKPFRF